jgi:hypothetical protein
MGSSIKDTTFCQLSKQMLKKEIGTYLELVSDPRFICRKCFRISNKKQNLCRPKKIKIA